MVLLLPSTSSRWKQQPGGGKSFSLPLYPPQSSRHTNTMELCKASSHTPLSDRRREERYLARRSFICCLWRSKEGCAVLLCFVALSLKPLSFPQHMDVKGGCSANLASCVTFWMGKKVDRILWPLHSKLVITQWPKAFFYLQTVSADLVEKSFHFHHCGAVALLLFYNIPHPSIFQTLLFVGGGELLWPKISFWKLIVIFKIF